MEVKKYNPFLIIKPKPKAKPLPKAKIKPTGSTRERSSKPKTELEAKGLTLDKKRNWILFMRKVLLRLVGNSLIIIDLVIDLIIDLVIDLVNDLVIDLLID